jgi:toxin ParE1/3/4
VARVIWTDPALDDLTAHRRFIARDSEFLASRTIEHILTAVDSLELFPSSGRVLPELNRPDVRRVIARRFLVIYQLRGEYVWIVMVHHSSRPLDKVELVRRLDDLP